MLLRRVARPLLAAPFVYDGVQAALRPADHVEAAGEGAALVTDALGTEPLSDRQVEVLVRAHGAATAAAGVLLAVGRTPRTAALALAALTAPLAVAHQPFTAPRDARGARVGAFVADLGKIGAAVIAGVDLEGRPGLAYRVRAARERAGKATERAAEKAAHQTQDVAREAARTAEKAAGKVAARG